MTDDDKFVTVSCPHCGNEFTTEDPYYKVEQTSGDDEIDLGDVKRIMFDLDASSARIVLVEHEGEEVLMAIPGGGLLCFGEPVTEQQIAIVLRQYMEERLLH